MNALLDLWKFGRARLTASVDGVSSEAENWRVHPEAHTIVEILYHLAGAEHYWWARLSGTTESNPNYDARIDAAVFDGFLRDGVSQFTGEELQISAAQRCLARTGSLIEPILANPTSGQLAERMQSPIGDEVTGEEGLIRLCSHAPYHVGQIWMMRMHPKFPD